MISHIGSVTALGCLLATLGCHYDAAPGGGGGSAPSALSYPSPVQGTVGTAIAALTPSVTGSVSTYSVSPALPEGLALDTASGVISGTPTAMAVQAVYTVTAANDFGNTTFALSLTVNPAAPSGLSYRSPVQATVGIAITLTPTVTGTVASYSVDPALPAGLALDATNGAVSGTPTATAAQASYTITASNVTGNCTFQLSLTVGSAANTTQPTNYTPSSTASLIQAALLQGQIDLPTSLMYRIWSLFVDPQLPPQYDGDDEGGEDESVFQDIQRTWSTMPPNVQAAIQPYLLRPTDAGSPFSTGRVSAAARARAAKSTAAVRATATARQQITAVGDIPACSSWVFSSSSVYGGFLKYWTCHTTDAEDAQVFATVDGIFTRHWDEMTGDMGIPRRDDGSGGDDSMDIYILDYGQCMPRNSGCRVLAQNAQSKTLALTIPAQAAAGSLGGSSAYLLLRKNRAISADIRFESDVVHEFFHALQFAHYSSDTRVVHYPNGTTAFDHSWFVEASAKWAEWAYVPAATPTEVEPWYPAASDVEEYADDVYQPGMVSLLRQGSSQHPYASYIWPFFMQQQSGGPEIVGNVWKAAEFAGNAAQINNAINAQLHFDSNFGEFMVRNLNYVFPGDPLKTHFWDMDPLFKRTAHPIFTDPGNFPDVGIGVPAYKTPLDFEIENLAANYINVHVQPGVGVQHLVLALDTDPASMNLESIAEVLDVNGGPATWKRFTSADNASLEFCLTDPEQNVDDLIVMIGNHRYDQSDSDLSTPTVKGTLTITADGDCGAWSGSITSVFKNLMTTTEGAAVSQSYEITTQTWTISGAQPDPNFPAYEQLRFNWVATDIVDDTYDLYGACDQSTRHTSTSGSASLTGSLLYDITPGANGAWFPGNPPSTTITPDPTKTWTPVYDQIACDGSEITSDGGPRTISNQLGLAIQYLPSGLQPDPNDANHYVGSVTASVGPGLTQIVSYDIRHHAK